MGMVELQFVFSTPTSNTAFSKAVMHSRSIVHAPLFHLVEVRKTIHAPNTLEAHQISRQLHSVKMSGESGAP